MKNIDLNLLHHQRAAQERLGLKSDRVIYSRYSKWKKNYNNA